MPSHEVATRNPACVRENRIHGDAVTQRYGSMGGLVPSLAVYGRAALFRAVA